MQVRFMVFVGTLTFSLIAHAEEIQHFSAKGRSKGTLFREGLNAAVYGDFTANRSNALDASVLETSLGVQVLRSEYVAGTLGAQLGGLVHSENVSEEIHYLGPRIELTVLPETLLPLGISYMDSLGTRVATRRDDDDTKSHKKVRLKESRFTIYYKANQSVHLGFGISRQDLESHDYQLARGEKANGDNFVATLRRSEWNGLVSLRLTTM